MAFVAISRNFEAILMRWFRCSRAVCLTGPMISSSCSSVPILLRMSAATPWKLRRVTSTNKLFSRYFKAAMPALSFGIELQGLWVKKATSFVLRSLNVMLRSLWLLLHTMVYPSSNRPLPLAFVTSSKTWSRISRRSHEIMSSWAPSNLVSAPLSTKPGLVNTPSVR